MKPRKIKAGLGGLLLLLFAISGYAQVPFVNVKDFGAKGDGTTDDTKAILQAFAKVASEQMSFQGIPGVYDQRAIYAGGSKMLYFPLGHYRVSKPLDLGLSYVHIIGEKAVISPLKTAQKGSVGFRGKVWQGHFEGMQLIGFDTALALNTAAIETGKLIVEDCDFVGNKVAVRIESYGALATIRENRFVNNLKAAILSGDKIDMSGNWITAGQLRGTHDAQIISNTVLHFDKNLLVPTVPATGATEPAWINNYREVIITGVRQGGEAGSFTLVNNFAQYASNPLWPNCVIIKESECYAVYGNEKNYYQPAALRLFEIPNMIVLQDLRGFISAKAMDFSRGITPASLVKSMRRGLDGNPPISVRVDNLMGAFLGHSNGSNVPDLLQKYIIK
jgi:hypothetical protein